MFAMIDNNPKFHWAVPCAYPWSKYQSYWLCIAIPPFNFWTDTQVGELCCLLTTLLFSLIQLLWGERNGITTRSEYEAWKQGLPTSRRWVCHNLSPPKLRNAIFKMGKPLSSRFSFIGKFQGNLSLLHMPFQEENCNLDKKTVFSDLIFC